jgi:hypothetical protein
MPARRADMTPTRVPDLTAMGRHLLEQGAYPDAARALGRQLRLAPADRNARYLLGLAWVGLGRHGLAREHFVLVAGAGHNQPGQPRQQDELATLSRAWLQRLAAQDLPR